MFIQLTDCQAKCTVLLKRIREGFSTQAFSWSVVNQAQSILQSFIRDLCKVCAFRKELSKQTVRILIRPSLPGRVWVSKVDLHAMCGFQVRVTGELFASICSRCLKRPNRLLRSRYAKGNLHRQCRAIGHLNRGVQTGFPFNEGRHTAFAFPTTRHHRI